MNELGEPDTVNPSVRFDEGEGGLKSALPTLLTNH